MHLILLPLIAPLISAALAQTCSNYGTASGSSCACPPGFNAPSSADCALPVCGGSLYDPAGVAPGGNGGYGNVSSGCACSEGWTGPGCTVCSASSACSSSLSGYLNSSNSITSSSLNTTLTCSSIPTVYSASQLSCSVIQPTLQALFPGASTATITRSLNSSRTPGGVDVLNQAGLEEGDGEVYLQLWYEGVEQFYCSAGGCAQTVAEDSGGGSVNASTWKCPSLKCTCRPGTMFCGGGTSVSQNLTGAINTLSGGLTIDCFPTGKCNFKQLFLSALFGSNGLELSSCSFGECVQQYVIDEALGITSSSGGDDRLSGGVIAGLAVVGAILLGVVVLVLWGFIMRRKARQAGPWEAPAAGSGVGVTWEGVGYEVKPTGEGLGSRTAAWLKGVGKPRRTAPGEEKGQAMGADGRRVVLRDVSGKLPPGGFCCILGPSGAGKSTLVDVLAGKRKAGVVMGNVKYWQSNREAAKKIKVGYVDQTDVLSPTSTVLEALLFAAHLRLPEHYPTSTITEAAHSVLSQLHLTHVAHTRIGSSEHRGISGGEARRVSIGIELVAAPDVLVLDEPTSGLDSVSAARLVRLLKGLAEEGTTIIASIHQPSSALYHAFDQVCLLSDGRQLYFGAGGKAPATFFERKGGRVCPEGYNIADHLLEIASEPAEEMGTTSVQSDTIGARSVESVRGPVVEETPIVEKGMSYPPAPTLLSDVQSTEARGRHRGRAWWMWPESHCATTFLTQLEVLSGREWRNLKRDMTLVVAHTILACILEVFAGGLYFKVGTTIAGFQNRVGSLFFLGSLVAFSSLSALYNLVEVRGLFLRERAGNFYSPQAWLLSRVIFDVIPLRLIPTILVSVIVYFMVGLSHDAARFFKFLLIVVEFSLSMTLFNFLLACLFSHGGIAILLSSLCNLFLMTYAGFFVNLSQIPPVLRWLRYFSTLGYMLEALAINEVGSGLQIVDSLNGVGVEIGATLIMETLFGFELGHYYRNVLVLFAFIAGLGVLLIGVVGYLLRERR